MKKSIVILLFLVEASAYAQVSAITPNPIISRGKTVYTSKGNAAYLVDNKYNTSSFTVANNSWIAIKVVSGPSKVFFSWNNPAYSWSDIIAAAHSCKGSYTFPVNYTIQTSSNSTNGVDGTWSNMVSVSGSNVTARGHIVNFSGASWIKMNILTGGGTLDEIEVFDASNSSNDIWFFVGTSISANTYKASPPSKNYADLITGSFTGVNPAMIRGGIPCINSGDLATDISKYLNMTRDVKYWAIEMGTNDAWGGSNANVTAYTKNLQLVIDSCKAAGIQPILARMIATNKTAATWQVHPDYLKTIDTLTRKNNLIEGPDLYTWFSTHASELNDDGVHPNAAGAASIQRLWAEKMAVLYPPGGATVAGINPGQATQEKIFIYPNPSDSGDFKILTAPSALGSTLQIYDANGKVVFTTIISDVKIHIDSRLPSGNYVVKTTGKQKSLTQQLIIQ